MEGFIIPPTRSKTFEAASRCWVRYEPCRGEEGLTKDALAQAAGRHVATARCCRRANTQTIVSLAK